MKFNQHIKIGSVFLLPWNRSYSYTTAPISGGWLSVGKPAPWSPSLEVEIKK